MEIRFRYRFEAAHRFLNASSVSCMTPHGHTWHATLHVHALQSLNAENMVVEFSSLKSFWKTFVSDVLDHSYLCNSEDSILPALLKGNPKARLLPFPGDPTTEMISLFLFHKCELMLAQLALKDRVRIAGITIEETPTNSIFCSREFYIENIASFRTAEGWWTTTDVHDRSFRRVESSAN